MPDASHHGKEYSFVLGHLLLISSGSFIGALTGMFINIYLVSKWKILLQGKHFWMRSLGATTIGEFIYTVVAISIMYANTMDFHKIEALIITSYTIKVIFNFLAIIPAAIVVHFLKKVEEQNNFETSSNFNPFSISIKPQS